MEHFTGTAPDVVKLEPGLLGWGDDAVAEAVHAVRASSLVVFASPTFKATYTGLLKLFLDQFAGGTGLQDVVAVPLMLGAGPGLYLIDATFAADPALTTYARRWTPVVAALTASR